MSGGTQSGSWADVIDAVDEELAEIAAEGEDPDDWESAYSLAIVESLLRRRIRELHSRVLSRFYDVNVTVLSDPEKPDASLYVVSGPILPLKQYMEEMGRRMHARTHA